MPGSPIRVTHGACQLRIPSALNGETREKLELDQNTTTVMIFTPPASGMKLRRASPTLPQQLPLFPGSNSPHTRSSGSTMAPLPHGEPRAHVQPIPRPGLQALDWEMRRSAALQPQLGAAESLWTTHPDGTKPTQRPPLLHSLLSPSHILHAVSLESTLHCLIKS